MKIKQSSISDVLMVSKMSFSDWMDKFHILVSKSNGVESNWPKNAVKIYEKFKNNVEFQYYEGYIDIDQSSDLVFIKLVENNSALINQLKIAIAEIDKCLGRKVIEDAFKVSA